MKKALRFLGEAKMKQPIKLNFWAPTLVSDKLKQLCSYYHALAGSSYGDSSYERHLDTVVGTVTEILQSYINQSCCSPIILEALSLFQLNPNIEVTFNLATPRILNGRTLEEAAAGHDLLEDTEVPEDLLRSIVSPFTFDIIKALTVPKGYSRKRAIKEFYPTLKNTPGAVFIKLVDRAVNVALSGETNKEKFFMYLKENPEFLRAIFGPREEIQSIEYFELLALGDLIEGFRTYGYTLGEIFI